MDVLFVTPQSRLEVYQGLSNEFAAIEPPDVLFDCKLFIEKNYHVKILDAEADNLMKKLLKK